LFTGLLARRGLFAWLRLGPGLLALWRRFARLGLGLGLFALRRLSAFWRAIRRPLIHRTRLHRTLLALGLFAGR